MSRINIGNFPSPPLSNERRDIEYQEDPGLGQTIGAAVNSEWVAPWAFRMLKQSWNNGYDPGFDPQEPDVWKELTRDVDPSYWSQFASAGNIDEALAIADNLRSVTASRRTLAEAGIPGVIASFGAAILDPVSIAAGFGVGGIVGKAGAAAGRASLGGRAFADAGLLGMASEVPIEAFLTSQDPDRGATDIILAGIGSFTLGGAGGYVSHRMAYKAAKADLDTTIRAMGAAAGDELRPRTLKDLISDDLLPPGVSRNDPNYGMFESRVRSKLGELNADDPSDPGLNLRAAIRSVAKNYTRGTGQSLDLSDVDLGSELDSAEIDNITEQARQILSGDSGAVASFDRLAKRASERPDGPQAKEYNAIKAIVDKNLAAPRTMGDLGAAEAAVRSSPQRDRVLGEVRDVFGAEQADAIAPVLDAFAAGVARRGGDYYGTLRVERGGKPGEEALYSTVAWHGTPHKFDKFDITKIGTGEGNQAYGHGLYFASRRGVAEWYREILSGKGKLILRKADGSAFDTNPDSSASRFRGETTAYINLQYHNGDFDRAISDLESPSFGGNVGDRRRGAEVLREWKDSGVTAEITKPGATYRVELSPNADEMLDWDKPLNQQSQGVQEAFRKLYPPKDATVEKHADGWRVTRRSEDGTSSVDFTIDQVVAGANKGKWGAYYQDGRPLGYYYDTPEEALQSVTWIDPQARGSSLYSLLTHGSESRLAQQAASEQLRKAGVPGIRYLDGSSRGAGEGAHNFVIFDDAAVEIKEMFQRGAGGVAQGSFEVAESGQRVIRALTNPNASTLPHEVAHDFMHMLPMMDPELAERAAKAVGAKSHAAMTVSHQENFARGFESYLRSGKAPSPALKEAFDAFKQWLVDIYQRIKGTPLEGRLNKDLKVVFDEMLTSGNAAPDPDAALKASLRSGLVNTGNDAELIEEALGPRWAETKEVFEGGYKPPTGDGLGYEPSQASDAPSVWGWMRRSIVSYATDKKLSPEIRKTGNSLLMDPLRKADGSVSAMSADQAQKLIHNTSMGELARHIRKPLADYVGDKTIPGPKRTPHEFFSAVIQEIEQPGSFNNKAIKEMAERGKTWYKGQLDKMRRGGLIDEDTYAGLAENTNYFPRYLEGGRIREFIRRFGKDNDKAGREGVRQVFAEAMRRSAGVSDTAFREARQISDALPSNYKLTLGNMTADARAKSVADTLTDAGLEHDLVVKASDAARRSVTDSGDSWDELDDLMEDYKGFYRMARFYVHTGESLGSLSDAETFRLFNGKQLESLRRILRDQTFDVENLTEENIDAIIARVDDEGKKMLSDSERGVAGNLRQRTPLDRYAAIDIEIPGEGVVRVSPNDFFDNNFAGASHRYSRAMSAGVVMKRFYEEAGKTFGRGDAPIRTRQGFMSALEQQLAKSVGHPDDKPFARAVYDRFDAALREIHGIPQTLDSAASEGRTWLRAIRRLANTVRNGSFAFAQLPELGRVVSYNGVRNTINALPALREMHNLAKAGKLSNDIYEYGDLLSGIMTSHEWNDSWSAFDPNDMHSYSRHTWIGRRDADLQKIERVSFFASGFAHIDRHGRRLSMAATLNKFVNDFTRGRPWNAKKLAQLGLSEDDAARITASLKSEMERGVALRREPGFMGQRVAKFRVSEFEDQYAVSQLVKAIASSTDRTIQQSTTGSKLLSQQTPIGQVGWQFWSFAIQGWEKHTLWGAQQILQGGDRAGVLASYLTGTMLGAVTYIGQTHLNAIGRGDSEEYLDKAMGEDEKGMRILMAGIQRGGNLTFLPQLVDMISVVGLGKDAPFDARASGLTFGGQFPVVQANPTTALGTDALRAIHGLGSWAFGGDDYSEQDFRAAVRLTPLQNHLGIRQLWNVIGSRFGEEERE